MTGLKRSLIESIAAELARSPAPSRVLRGIGDDAAVVRARPLCVTSVDALIDGVHFRLREGWASAADVGHRALAGALSDLAAMGADAGEAYLVLGLPAGFSQDSAMELMRAANALAQASGAVIAGGDVVAAPILTVAVTAVGWAEREQEPVGRSGALPGERRSHRHPRRSRRALAVLSGRAPRTPASQSVLARAASPTPRLPEGRALARVGVHAMIDLSDGLATDAAHIGRASGVSLRVQLPALPCANGVAEVAAALGQPPWQLAAGGGEDYELCFCARPADRARVERAVDQCTNVQVTWVGQVVDGEPGVALSDGEHDVRIEGFEHRW